MSTAKDEATRLIATTDQALEELRSAMSLVPNELLGPAFDTATKLLRAAEAERRAIAVIVFVAALDGIMGEMARRAESVANGGPL